MPTLHLTTFVAAPAEIVFDLTRHIGLHKETMAAHTEDAVAGIRFGLLEKDDTVTWRAKHFFKTRLLRVKVTAMKKPELFINEQASGDFKNMKHEHYFKPCDNGTILINLFHFETPYGFLGGWFNEFFLNKYLLRLLSRRSAMIKEVAESGRWKTLLIK